MGAAVSMAAVVAERVDKAPRGGAPARAARVLVAEHDRATLFRIQEILGDSSGFTICAEEANAVDAVARALSDAPDLCLLDVGIPGGGVAAAWEISARLPQTKIVMLTRSHLGRGLVAALAAGFSGYLRTDRLERLPPVLEAVMAGEIAIPRASVAQIAAELRQGRARRRAVAETPHSVRLTSREWEVMRLLCDGQGTAGIARRLGISQATVRSHIAGALRKLGPPRSGVGGASAHPAVAAPTSPDQWHRASVHRGSATLGR